MTTPAMAPSRGLRGERCVLAVLAAVSWGCAGPPAGGGSADDTALPSSETSLWDQDTDEAPMNGVGPMRETPMAADRAAHAENLETQGTARFIVQSQDAATLVEYERGSIRGSYLIAKDITASVLSPGGAEVAYFVDQGSSGAGGQWWLRHVGDAPLPAAVPVPVPEADASFGTWLAFVPDGSGIMFDTLLPSGLRQLWYAELNGKQLGQAALVGAGLQFDLAYEGVPVLDPLGRWFAVRGVSVTGRYGQSVLVGSLVKPSPYALNIVGDVADGTRKHASLVPMSTGEGLIYTYNTLRSALAVGVVGVDVMGAVTSEEQAEIDSYAAISLSPDARWLVGVSGRHLARSGGLDAQRLEGASIATPGLELSAGAVPIASRMHWSPDGRWLVYEGESGSEIVDMSGRTPGDPSSILGGSDISLGQFSPTSDAYFFAVQGEGVYRETPLLGSDLLTAAPRVAELALSGEGEWMTYVVPRSEDQAPELWVASTDPASRPAPRVAPERLAADEAAFSPVFSADGSTVVYRVGVNRSRPCRVHVFDHTGSTLVLEAEGVDDAMKVKIIP